MQITKEDVDSSERFLAELQEYLDEYKILLESKYSSKTVGIHVRLIRYCIEYVCGYGYAKGFEEITLGKCGSKMVASYNSVCHESMQNGASKKIMYRFFEFIYQQYGIANHKLLNDLKKQI